MFGPNNCVVGYILEPKGSAGTSWSNQIAPSPVAQYAGDRRMNINLNYSAWTTVHTAVCIPHFMVPVQGGFWCDVVCCAWQRNTITCKHWQGHLTMIPSTYLNSIKSKYLVPAPGGDVLTCWLMFWLLFVIIAAIKNTRCKSCKYYYYCCFCSRTFNPQL